MKTYLLLTTTENIAATNPTLTKKATGLGLALGIVAKHPTSLPKIYVLILSSGPEPTLTHYPTLTCEFLSEA